MAESESNEVLGGIAPRDYTSPEAGYGISSVADPRIAALADMLRAKRTATRPESDADTSRASRLQRFKDKASGTRSAMKGQQFMPSENESLIREVQDVFFNPLNALEAEQRAQYTNTFDPLYFEKQIAPESLTTDLRELQAGYGDIGHGAAPGQIMGQLNYEASGLENPFNGQGFRIGDSVDQDVLLGQNVRYRTAYTPGQYRDYEVRYNKIPESSDVRIGDVADETFQTAAELGLDDQAGMYAEKLFNTNLDFIGAGEDLTVAPEKVLYKNPDTGKYEYIYPERASDATNFQQVSPEAYRRLGESLSAYIAENPENDNFTDKLSFTVDELGLRPYLANPVMN
jgi:hypothetical protein